MSEGERLGPYPLDTVVTGDACVLAEQVPPHSIDCLFCDPVYDRRKDYLWLAGIAERVLNPRGAVLLGQNQSALPTQPE